MSPAEYGGRWPCRLLSAQPVSVLPCSSPPPARVSKISGQREVCPRREQHHIVIVVACRSCHAGGRWPPGDEYARHNAFKARERVPVAHGACLTTARANSKRGRVTGCERASSGWVRECPRAGRVRDARPWRAQGSPCESSTETFAEHCRMLLLPPLDGASHSQASSLGRIHYQLPAWASVSTRILDPSTPGDSPCVADVLGCFGRVRERRRRLHMGDSGPTDAHRPVKVGCLPQLQTRALSGDLGNSKWCVSILAAAGTG